MENSIELIGLNKTNILYPFWNDVKVAICVCSSNEYVPYLSVYLKSIIENCSRKKDIVIFENGISMKNKEILIRNFSGNDTSIRFVNPSSLFKDINLHVYEDYWAEECFYRIAAPLLLQEYEKIIFTDIDLIACDDILKLADFNMRGYPIAACIEPIWQEFYLENTIIHGMGIRTYTDDILKFSNKFMYYNTGVLVFDVQECNNLNCFHGLIDIIANNKLLYQEQDAINIFFKDKFYTLPSEWNFELGVIVRNNIYKFDFYYKYIEKEKESKIIHYLGCCKPWINTLEYKADIWWKYARNTPYYEDILQCLVQIQNSEHNTRIQKIAYILDHVWYFKIKKISYKIKRKFLNKEKRKIYEQKYRVVKLLLKEAKILKKNLTRI